MENIRSLVLEVLKKREKQKEKLLRGILKDDRLNKGNTNLVNDTITALLDNKETEDELGEHFGIWRNEN